jgi:hypothetical protein
VLNGKQTYFPCTLFTTSKYSRKRQNRTEAAIWQWSYPHMPKVILHSSQVAQRRSGSRPFQVQLKHHGYVSSKSTVHDKVNQLDNYENQNAAWDEGEIHMLLVVGSRTIWEDDFTNPPFARCNHNFQIRPCLLAAATPYYCSSL